MKSIIKGRWDVEGYYLFRENIRLWQYHCPYCPEGVVLWDIGEFTITCTCDGREQFTIPYAVVWEDILLLNFSDDFHHHVDRYRVRLRDDVLWLQKIDASPKIAIKMRME